MSCKSCKGDRTLIEADSAASSLRSESEICVPFNIGSHRYSVCGWTPSEVKAEIKKINRRLGLYKSDGLIEDLIYSHWKNTKPKHYENYMRNLEFAIKTGRLPSENDEYEYANRKQGATKRNEMNVDRMGPIIWKFLNLFSVYWDQEHFLGTIDMITHLLNPNSEKSDAAGCPKCYEHWLQLMATYPPEDVNSSWDAANYILKVHNRVNEVSGKRLFTYREMVLQYGAPLDIKRKEDYQDFNKTDEQALNESGNYIEQMALTDVSVDDIDDIALKDVEVKYDATTP